MLRSLNLAAVQLERTREIAWVDQERKICRLASYQGIMGLIKVSKQLRKEVYWAYPNSHICQQWPSLPVPARTRTRNQAALKHNWNWRGSAHQGNNGKGQRQPFLLARCAQNSPALDVSNFSLVITFVISRIGGKRYKRFIHEIGRLFPPLKAGSFSVGCINEVFGVPPGSKHISFWLFPFVENHL